MTSDEETDEPPWLSREQLQDWVALMAMIGTLPAALDAQLRRDAGLNLFEYQILVQLNEAPQGALPMTDLSIASHGSPSRLSHAVSRLEKAGYVSRTTCREADRRTAAVLTEAGLAKLRESAPGHVREARRLVVDVLTPAQLKALGEAARAMTKANFPEVMDKIGP